MGAMMRVAVSIGSGGESRLDRFGIRIRLNAAGGWVVSVDEGRGGG
jgi:hypothetical protein